MATKKAGKQQHDENKITPGDETVKIKQETQKQITKKYESINILQLIFLTPYFTFKWKFILKCECDRTIDGQVPYSS